MSATVLFAGVIQLAGCYAAISSGSNGVKFISQKLEKEERVARAAANAFAEQNKVKVAINLIKLDKPIVTICQHDEAWVPAVLDSESFKLLTDFGKEGVANISLKGTAEQAKNLANSFALMQGYTFHEEIGASFMKVEESKSKK